MVIKIRVLGEIECCFDILYEARNVILIKDFSEDSECAYRSVTNSVEQVVKYLADHHNLGTKRLFYVDTDNRMDEIVFENDEFRSFRML